MKCAECDEEHDEVFIHSRCHPSAPTWVRVTPHEVIIECAECEEEITRGGGFFLADPDRRSNEVMATGAGELCPRLGCRSRYGVNPSSETDRSRTPCGSGSPS